MGTIATRKTQSGELRYRAQVRIKRQDGTDFSDSKTFSKKSLAQDWIKRREAELELNPALLSPTAKLEGMTLAQALDRYRKEVASTFGRSKIQGLIFLQAWPIARKRLIDLKRADFSGHISLRRAGWSEIDAPPIAPSTANQDLYYLRALLKHADAIWGIDLAAAIGELDRAREGLKAARMVAKSRQRDRLPTASELKQLHAHFEEQWQRGRSRYPMHWIMWLAIYTCRRQSELTRLVVDDLSLVTDLKNPSGTKGNNRRAVIPDRALPVIECLRDELKEQRGSSQYVLPLDAKTVSALWTRACHMLGIEDLHFHDLRHEGATRLAEDGLTIPQIQAITLHDTWASLSVYVDLQPRGNRLDFDKL